MIDVIVVGGGPAGSRTAYMLARLGWGVTVLEKEGAVGNKSCCTLHPDTGENFLNIVT